MADHKRGCGCQICSKLARLDVGYVGEYAMALESGTLRLFHLCRDSEQDNSQVSWELLKSMAMMASQHDLRGYVTGLDTDARGAASARAKGRFH